MTRPGRKVLPSSGLVLWEIKSTFCLWIWSFCSVKYEFQLEYLSGPSKYWWMHLSNEVEERQECREGFFRRFYCAKCSDPSHRSHQKPSRCQLPLCVLFTCLRLSPSLPGTNIHPLCWRVNQNLTFICWLTPRSSIWLSVITSNCNKSKRHQSPQKKNVFRALGNISLGNHDEISQTSQYLFFPPQNDSFF